MDIKNYTDVLIGGKVYTLGGFVEESYLQKVASYINEVTIQLKKQDGFSKQSEDYQAVMIELNIADDYFKAKKQAEELSKANGDLEKEIYSLKHELVGGQLKIEALQKELELERQKLLLSEQQISKLKSEDVQEKAIQAARENYQHRNKR